MKNTIQTTAAPKESCPITHFVNTLGQRLLQKKVKDWLDIDGVVRFCQDQKIDPGSNNLEATLRSFFSSSAEFNGSNVNVDGYERRRGWDRVFMIRAYPYHPKRHSISE